MFLLHSFKRTLNQAPSYRSSLKFSLILAMLATVGATALIVYLPWMLASQRSSKIIIRLATEDISKDARKEVQRLFTETQSVLKLVASQVNENIINYDTLDEKETLFLNILVAFPDFTWVQSGFPNGNFFGAERKSKTELAFHIREWNATTKNSQETIRIYRQNERRLIYVTQESHLMKVAYFAPQRPWYKNAILSNGAIAWTVYPYRSKNVPGMDATLVIKKQDVIRAVGGVGINLTMLSDYLASIKTDFPAEIFIINSQKQLLSSNDTKETLPITNPLNSNVTLKKLNQSKNRLLQFASQTIENNHIDILKVNNLQHYRYVDPATGESYWISLSPIGYLDWVVGSAIPESLFLQPLHRSNFILIFTIVFFVPAVAAGAIYLIDRQVISPILGISNAVKDISAGKKDVKVPILSQNEIGILAKSFNQMTDELRDSYESLETKNNELELARTQLAMANIDLEGKVQKRTIEVEMARAEAETANATKSIFLANMSHELRTPLNAIIGYSEILQEEAEDMGEEDFVKDLKKIRWAGKHLLELINSVLDISKIESGRMDLYLENFGILPVLDEIVSTIQPLLEKNNNTLTVNCSPNIGVMFADVTKVRQSLFNLISNASKFTQNGNITLTINRYLKAEKEWISMQVKDTGIGITPEQMAKLFKPFSQADALTTRKYGGTGLGLVITQKFSQMMGGDIGIESEFGMGTTFTITLPAQVGDHKNNTLD